MRCAVRADETSAIHLIAKSNRENVGVALCPRLRLCLHARNHVELDDAMIFVGGILGRRVSLTLLGHDVDQHWSFLGVTDIFENLDQCANIVPINWPDIIKSELVEERSSGD